MALTLNGTTGCLEHAAKIAGGYPFSMLVWGTRASSATQQFWISQSQTDDTRCIGGYHAAADVSKVLYVQEPGQGRSASKATAPDASATVFQLMVIVATSPSDQKIYFGTSSSPAQNTNAVADGVVNHNVCVVGARHFNSAGIDNFTNGDLAEAHYYSTALTVPQIDTLLTGSKPELTSGWVDGWDLKYFQPSGNYISIGGSRTMVAVGGVTQSVLTHPVTRSAPSQTLTAANCTQANTSSTGAISQTTPPPGVNLVSATCTQVNNSSSVAISQSGGSSGTINHRPLGRNGHNSLSPQLWTNETGVTIRYRSMTTGLTVLSKTGWTTNGAGVPPPVTDALLVPGTSYEVMFILANGVRGFDVLAAV